MMHRIDYGIVVIAVMIMIYFGNQLMWFLIIYLESGFIPYLVREVAIMITVVVTLVLVFTKFVLWRRIRT